MSEMDRYYETVFEYTTEFEINMRTKLIQKKMFTIRDTEFKVLLDKYLVDITLDNPRILLKDVNVFEKAKSALEDTIENVGLDKKLLKIRRCNNCFCHSNYLNGRPEDIRKMFWV